jgi:hypothetical protein
MPDHPRCPLLCVRLPHPRALSKSQEHYLRPISPTRFCEIDSVPRIFRTSPRLHSRWAKSNARSLPGYCPYCKLDWGGVRSGWRKADLVPNRWTTGRYRQGKGLVP